MLVTFTSKHNAVKCNAQKLRMAISFLCYIPVINFAMRFNDFQIDSLGQS